jgi:16S rRNA (cytosine1402-N4)-methyltransferase
MSKTSSSPEILEKKHGAPKHVPVLFNETVQCFINSELAPKDQPQNTDTILLDATFGGGGHTRGLMKAFPNSRVWAIDRDPAAQEKAEELKNELRENGEEDRFRLFQKPFSEIEEVFKAAQEELSKSKKIFEGFDGILADIGLSSFQIDQAERGFSFKKDGPLDMRMDQGAEDTQSVEELLKTIREKDLADLIFTLGEERLSRKIARFICEEREKTPFTSTAQLAHVVRRAYGPKNRKKPNAIDPATKTFQALRMYVNGELEELERLLDRGTLCLRPGARMVVISFHSLEDRLVKRAFNELSKTWEHDDQSFTGRRTLEPRVKKVTKKPIVPGSQEKEENPRARSAKLRCVEKQYP